MTPAGQILELMMNPRDVRKLFNKYIIEEESKRKGRQSMEKWMDMKNIKVNHSKTAKQPKISAKITKKSDKIKKSKVDYKNLPYIGTTKRIECQNMGKWMKKGDIVDTEASLDFDD